MLGVARHFLIIHVQFLSFFIDSCLNKITAKDAANELNRLNVIGFGGGGGGGSAVGLFQKNGKERLPFFSFFLSLSPVPLRSLSRVFGFFSGCFARPHDYEEIYHCETRNVLMKGRNGGHANCVCVFFKANLTPKHSVFLGQIKQTFRSC